MIVTALHLTDHGRSRSKKQLARSHFNDAIDGPNHLQRFIFSNFRSDDTKSIWKSSNLSAHPPQRPIYCCACPVNACLFAAAKLLFSPCFPPWTRLLVSHITDKPSCALSDPSPTGAEKSERSYLPLGEPELHVPPGLGGEPLLLLERAAHDARGYREVAVVSMERRVSSCSPRRQRW
jgi:hypothetical protein